MSLITTLVGQIMCRRATWKPQARGEMRITPAGGAPGLRVRGIGLRVLLVAALFGPLAPALGAGDAARGAQVFRACMACHTLEPDRNLTGPSLAGVWGRKAGTLASFPRFSKALREAGVRWNAQTLDTWLRDPQAMVPGNYMLFPGLSEARARDDVIEFLRAASSGNASQPAAQRPPTDLKRAPEAARIVALRHCRDTYYVTNAAGETVPFWEFNLRIKTDSSPSGPAPGAPVMVGAGMQGDRAQLVFSTPAEISSFVKEGC